MCLSTGASMTLEGVRMTMKPETKARWLLNGRFQESSLRRKEPGRPYILPSAQDELGNIGSKYVFAFNGGTEYLGSGG
jgi:hypothetical protein